MAVAARTEVTVVAMEAVARAVVVAARAAVTRAVA